MFLLFKIKLGFLKSFLPYNISFPSKSVTVPPACFKIACPAAISHSHARGSATYPSYSPAAMTQNFYELFIRTYSLPFNFL